MVLVKRFMALLTASLLFTSMTVSASGSPSTSEVAKKDKTEVVTPAARSRLMQVKDLQTQRTHRQLHREA